MDANALTQLGGTALAVGVLIYMLHYFMQREERREEFVAKVIEANTSILRDNTNALRELKEAIRPARSG